MKKQLYRKLFRAIINEECMGEKIDPVYVTGFLVRCDFPTIYIKQLGFGSIVWTVDKNTLEMYSKKSNYFVKCFANTIVMIKRRLKIKMHKSTKRNFIFAHKA